MSSYRKFTFAISSPDEFLVKTSGSIKECSQTSSEMGISCQQNGCCAATDYLSGPGLVQPIKQLSSAAGSVLEGAVHSLGN